MRPLQSNKGFTLIELMVVLVATTLLLLGLTTVLANSQKAFSKTQDQLFGPVVTDAYGVQGIFDHFVRGSTQKYCQVDDNNLAVFYYSDPNAGLPDRYAQFSWSGTEGDSLTLTTGALSSPGEYDSWEAGNKWIIANDVIDCQFVQYGATLRIYITLDDGEHEVSFSTSATRQNKT